MFKCSGVHTGELSFNEMTMVQNLQCLAQEEWWVWPL